MELGLGLKTCFSLETENPIFVNFRLSSAEAEEIQRSLPPGFTLQKLRFFESDPIPEYWMSYNLYWVRYPKPRLQAIRKVRCEINTFVADAAGNKGVYVFCGSPYVSQEMGTGLLGWICDQAEQIVMFLYGCGKLVPLNYQLSNEVLKVSLKTDNHLLSLHYSFKYEGEIGRQRLSPEYLVYNDISFFGHGKTFDLVNVNSAFVRAEFDSLDDWSLGYWKVQTPFFQRAPDGIYFHRGEIKYLVNSLNRVTTLRQKIIHSI